jgi:4-hydroxy-tetrahydrodipicolinate synthase
MRLTGLIPATVTPFAADGTVDHAALGAHLGRLAAIDGLGGLAVNMDTGEGPALSPDERLACVRTAVDAAAGRVPVIAGIGAPTTAGAVDATAATADAGAAAVVVFPHPSFAGDPACVVPHHAAIAAVGVPIILFQLQAALGGVLFDPPTLDTLLGLPNVVALKEASFDPVHFCATKAAMHGSGVTLLTGNDLFVPLSLRLGAEGSLIGLGSVFAAEQAALHTAIATGDDATAERLARDVVDPLAALLFAAPVGRYRARVKQALLTLGEIPSADVRAPLLPLHGAEATAIDTGIEALR